MRLLGVKLPANGNEARRSPFAPPPAPDAVLASATPPPHRRHVPPPAAPARGRPGLPAPPPPAIPGAGPHLQPLLHPRRLLNSLLPHLTTSHLHLLRLLPFDHLTLLLLSSGPNRHASPLPAASSLHALAVCSGHLPADLRLANSLLARYLALGSHASARRLFADIPRPDAVTWNTLLRACLRSGLLPSARQLFDQMPERDLVSFNSMLSGYAAAGDMAGARELFDGMPERDVVSWNSMLAGYTRCGDMENARRMFDAMPERDVVSWNTMLDGYAQAGDVKMARVVFDDMPRRSAVSWNVVLALYARVKDWQECLRLFDAMMAVGAAVPNEKTFVSILTACGSLGDLERGKWVHGLVRQRWERLVPDVLLLTALLTMYVKCGVMETAREIFDSMTERSVPSWNSMIIGYGLHGQSEKALELFLEMERSGPKPNETTFVCVLSSCAHGGLVLEGWWCFDRMVRLYGVEPKAEHFGCMMDLLGRAGLLTGSESLVQNLQGKASPALWGAMVSASRTQNRSKLGEFVGKKLIEMKPTEVGPYVLLSNIYAAEGRWDDVEKVREMMKENGVEKDVGLSLVGSSEAEPRLGIEDGVVLSMLGEMGAHLKLPSESEQPRCREGKGGHKLLCVTTEGSNGSQKSKPGARPYFSSSNAAALFPPPEPKQQRPPSDCSTKGRGQTPPVQAFHQPPAGTGGKANLTSPSRGAAGIYRPTGFATTATADKAARAPEEKPESTSSRSAPYPRKKHRASPTETTTRLHSLLYRAPPGQIRLPLPTQRRQGRPGEREAQI